MNSKKVWTDAWQKVNTEFEDTQVLFDFLQSGDATKEEMEEQYEKCLHLIEDLELKNMLSSKEDQLNAVMQITAGAGGTESCDWAAMLMRMYIMWGEKNGYKVTEQDFQPGEVTGVKTVTLPFAGDFSYGESKGENCVQPQVRN